MTLPIIHAYGYDYFDCSSLVSVQHDGSGNVLHRSTTDGLAIHHAGISLPTYYANHDAEEAQLISLAQYDAKTWGASSYHAYAFPSGAVYVVGDGTVNLPGVAYENDHLEGILLVGDFSTNPVPPGIIGGVAQWILYKWKQHRFMPVKGHRDWVNLVLHPTWATSCPGDKGVASIDTMLRVVEALARCP